MEGFTTYKDALSRFGTNSVDLAGLTQHPVPGRKRTYLQISDIEAHVAAAPLSQQWCYTQRVEK